MPQSADKANNDVSRDLRSLYNDLVTTIVDDRVSKC